MTQQLIITAPAIPRISIAAMVPRIDIRAGGPRGPAGPSGAGYDHVQSDVASTWTINHNLGFRPSVELMTTGGVEFEAEVQHTSINQCVVTLNTAMAGRARLL